MATTTYLRLFPAVKQFELKNGALNVGGRLFVYYEGTDDLAEIYDENGTRLQQPAILDNDGRALGLFVDAKKVYRLEVQDAFGAMQFTVRKMVPSGGGAGSALGKTYDVVSNDGSILVDKFDEGGTTTFDLSLGIDANELKPSCLKASAAPVTTDGKFVFEELVREGNLLSVDQSGKVRMEPAWYHFTAIVELSYDGTPVNEAHQVTLWTTLSNSVIDLDTSYVHRESIELSGDIHVVGNNTEFPLGVSGLDTGITASLTGFDIHAVTGHEGNNEYHAGEGIIIASSTKTISADFDSVQGKLVAGDNISITGNVISAGNFSQEQADWTEEDTESRAYIRNKPDLDVFATKAEVTTGLAGKQDTIPDLAQIRAGATAGASAVQPADLAAVATTGSYNDLNHRPNLDQYATDQELTAGLATKQDVISDLATIRSGAAAGATAVQPADLDAYATDAELTAGLATKQDTINDLSTIRSGSAAGATALQPSDVAAVATSGDYDDLTNKPSIPTATSDLTNDSGFITSADVPVKDVQVDGASVVNAQGTAEIDLSGYATTQALTTGLAGKEDSSNKSQTIDPSSTTEFPSSAATANFVNSSVATATANFLGNFTLTDLGLTYPATGAQIGAALDAHVWPTGVTPTNNDYTYIEIENPQSTLDNRVERFKFNGSNWVYEYTLNNSSFTAAEKAAIDSGIDSAKVAVYDAHVANSDIHVTTSDKATWNAKQDTISDLAQIRAGAAEGATAVQPGDLATVATTGSYDDLADKPTIPAAQVNSDWNSNSGVSQILNKPTLATVATTGDYDDLSNKPSIPAAQVNSDWNATSGVSEILNKPTIPTVDQNYNALSTHAQSGVAVAQAIASIPSSSSSYTAGDGIDITDSEISVNYDSGTLGVKLKQQPVTKTYDVDSYNSNYGVTPPEIANQLRTVAVTVHIPGNTFYQWYMSQSAVIVFMDNSSGRIETEDVAYCATPLSYTFSDGQFWLDEQDVVFTALVGPIINCDYFAFGMLDGSYLDSTPWLCDTGRLASPVQFSYTDAGVYALAVKNPLPASTVSDADKVLIVNAQGTPAWSSAQAPISAGTGIDITNNVVSVDNTVAMKSDLPTVPTAGNMLSVTNNVLNVDTTAGITDVQLVAALPAQPEATVVYLIPET